MSDKSIEEIYAAAEGFELTEYGDMCPNCVTPWKCNGPHLQPPKSARDAQGGFYK